MMRDWLSAMSLDHMIGIYLTLAFMLILALLYQVADMVWHAYHMRRARRRSRRVIAFRRAEPSRLSLLMALLVMNIGARWLDVRERWRAWRHGDRVIGDHLLDRMGKLR